MNSGLIGIKQACDFLEKKLGDKMYPQLLLYYIITGRGPECQRLGRYYYFHPDDIKEWEKPEPEPCGPRHKAIIPKPKRKRK